jgi:hypothetical protein
MLSGCDAVVEAGHLARISLAPEMLLRPDATCNLLASLLESELLPFLTSCAITLEQAKKGDEGGDVAAGFVGKLTVFEGWSVPHITLRFNSEGQLISPSLQFEYELNHAHKRAQVANAVSQITKRCDLLLQNQFQNLSLQRQISGLANLKEFLAELFAGTTMGSREDGDTGLTVRFGTLKSKVEFEEGVLNLPIDFDLVEVKKVFEKT